MTRFAPEDAEAANSSRPVPTVSVVIPIYNGEADIPQLLDCLRAQTYPPEQVEYLLVDNGSGDRTLDLLQAFALERAAAGWQVRCLQETQIQSSYAARNTGVRAAQSDILAFTDADCRPQPGWLQALVQPFSDPIIGPTLGIVAGEIVALPSHTLLERHADRQDTLSQKHTLAHPFRPYGQTANLAVRRQAIEQAGLFRSYLTTGGDADLCWRILQSGQWQIHLAEGAVVRHRHRATLEELRKQWRRYGRSNRFLHDLYQVDLMRTPNLQEYLYRIARWLLKELPTTLVQALRGKADWVDLLSTPIGLLCVQARTQGQQQAQLPQQARQLEWLSDGSPAAAPDLSHQTSSEPSNKLPNNVENSEA